MMLYSLKRATAWNILGYIYLLIASFISTPILVQYLGITQFSTYSLVMASTIFVSAINLGLPQAVVRALAIEHKFSKTRQTIWASSSLIFILTGILAGIIAVALVYPLHLSISLLIIIFGIGLVNNLVSHYLTLPQAEGHFGYFNLKTFIIGSGNTLLAALLAYLGYDILAILTMQLFTYWFTLLPLAYFSLKFFPNPRDGKFSLSVIKSLTSFGLKSWGGKLIGQVQSQYAKYLLAALSPLTLSVYVISQGLIQKLVGVVAQIATSFYPASARSEVNPSIHKIYLQIQISLLVLGLVTIIAFGYVGLPFLSWWLKDPVLVESVYTFIEIYRYYGLLLLLTPLASTILESYGYPGTASLFGVFTFIIEIISAIVMFPHYGILAIAYAGIISLGIMTPVVLLYTEYIVLRGKKSN